MIVHFLHPNERQVATVAFSFLYVLGFLPFREGLLCASNILFRVSLSSLVYVFSPLFECRDINQLSKNKKTIPICLHHRFQVC